MRLKSIRSVNGAPSRFSKPISGALPVVAAFTLRMMPT
jgi:hypothetical protein